MSPVRYPFARSPEGAAIHIRDYTEGAIFCFECSALLIAKRGQYVEWHYAHHPDADTECTGETAMHMMSKIAIAQQHAAARQEGREYRIRWICEHCQSEQSFDCAKRWPRAIVEHEAIESVRSDVYFEGEKPFAIEVVVSNYLSPATHARYLQANVPVFIFRPQFDDVRDLRDHVMAAETLGLQSNRCNGCTTKLQRERELEALFNRLREKLRDEPLRDRAAAYRDLGDWPPNRDPAGNQLFSSARQRIRDRALRLLQSGFIQHRHKRWVFSKVLPEGVGEVHVGLAGHGIDPAWSRRAPAMELRLKIPLARVETFGDLINWYLGRRGVDVNGDWRVNAKLAIEAHRARFGLKRKRLRKTVKRIELDPDADAFGSS